jgi:pyruvate formate-lyase 1-activating enzyme
MANALLEKAERITGSVYHTETFGAVDGPGIRYVLFLQGCSLHCLYCHNPDAIALRGGEIWTVRQAFEEILRYRRFIQSGGITFSGGEPLLQAEFVQTVSALLKQEGIHIAIDTAGHVPLQKVQTAVDMADLLLLDIKAEDTGICKALTGSGNENAFRLLDYCEQHSKPVWIRHVLLHGYTLADDQLHALAKRLQSYRCIERVELLPFHKLGEPKWENVKMEYLLTDTPATTKAEHEHAKKIFAEYGFEAQ